MNAGLREPRLHMDHRMILAEIHGEGAMCNKRYRQGITWWPIQRIIHRPQTEQDATLDNLKDTVDKDMRSTTARVD